MTDQEITNLWLSIPCDDLDRTKVDFSAQLRFRFAREIIKRTNLDWDTRAPNGYLHIPVQEP